MVEREMTNKVYLSMGSNIGDKLKNIESAISMLNDNEKISLVKTSDVYETEPVGTVKQDDFYNLAVYIETDLSAEELLKLINLIEQKLKRKRIIHWGPRTIDLDILYFNDENINNELLTVPHPEISNRRFVLEPLLDVLEDQTKRVQVEAMLAKTPDKNWIRKIS